MRVAIVYDWVDKWGGAEGVLLALREIFPEAPLYTSVYNPKTALWARVFKVIPSFSNKMPLIKFNRKLLAWLAPLAFESFDFSGFDVVISVTSAFAKGIITSPKTLHICYCLTPTRFLWSGRGDYSQGFYRIVDTLTIPDRLKRWDLVAGQRPDVYAAVSKCVRERIRRYYEREAEVICPPVDIRKFKVLHQRRIGLWSKSEKFKVDEYFLIVSRLVKYKKVGLAVEAFNKLGLPLKIIGVGEEFEGLRRMAKKNVEFLGQLTDEELIKYYQNCRAVIFPQEEDFGLVPIEAQACGKPVIAYRAGGVLETVVEGKTGLFFSKQTIEDLKQAIEKFRIMEHALTWQECRKNAERFDKKIFKKNFYNFVIRSFKTFKGLNV